VATLYSEDLPGFERSRRRPGHQSIQVEGPRRGTQGQGAVGPSARACSDLASPQPVRRRGPRGARNCLAGPALASDIGVKAGGALCRTMSAPARVSQHRWGVSDPACVPNTRPQGRPAGSLTPRMSVSTTCLGACAKCRSNTVANDQHFQ
jgi:hypothetical protein